MSLIDQLYELERAAFPDKHFSKRQIKYLVQKGKGAFSYIRRFDSLIGYAYITPVSKKIIRIYSIAVHPTKQNRGIGNVILRSCELWSFKKGYKYIRLEVSPQNKKAIGLYKKMGYKLIKQKKHYYGQFQHAWIYQKDLCAVNE